MVNARAKHLWLTGPPGCGKTTVVLRLVERLRDLRLQGFYTEELREHGQRVAGATWLRITTASRSPR